MEVGEGEEALKPPRSEQNKRKRGQTKNWLSWEQDEHFTVLPNKASRDFGCLFLLGCTQTLEFTLKRES